MQEYTRREFWAIERYVSAVEDYLARAEEDLLTRLGAELRDSGRSTDAAAVASERSRVQEVARTVLPRYARWSSLVMLWATYESAIREFAEVLRTHRGVTITLDAVQARDFLGRTKLYFRDVLRVELAVASKAWHRAHIVYGLRNRIVHAGGRADSGSTWERRIAKWGQQTVGVEVREGRLFLDDAFLAESLDLFRSWLVEQFTAVDRALPRLQHALQDEELSLER